MKKHWTEFLPRPFPLNNDVERCKLLGQEIINIKKKLMSLEIEHYIVIKKINSTASSLFTKEECKEASRASFKNIHDSFIKKLTTSID